MTNSMGRGSGMILGWVRLGTLLWYPQDFPGGPVVETPRFHFRGHGFNPWSGN